MKKFLAIISFFTTMLGVGMKFALEIGAITPINVHQYENAAYYTVGTGLIGLIAVIATGCGYEIHRSFKTA